MTALEQPPLDHAPIDHAPIDHTPFDHTPFDRAPLGDLNAGHGPASIVALVAHARSVPSLEREAFAAELAALGDDPDHIVVHTCHRVEVYLSPGSSRHPLPTLPAGTRTLTDAAAVEHLISVACGLDSAVIGETQILHQLRETIAERSGERALEPTLDRLFQSALHAGRSAHAWYSGSPRSLADVALDRISGTIGDLAGRRILVVGVGKMGRLAAFAAMRRGCAVSISNRGTDRAAALASEVDGDVVPFGLAGPDRGSGQGIDGVVVAIAGPWDIGAEESSRLAESGAIVVDLSSPPAVSVELQRTLDRRFISVDELAEDDGGPNERVRRRLEKLISDSGRDYCTWLRTRDAVPAIHAVVTAAEQHRREELDWVRHRLATLSDEDMAVVEQMSHRLVAAILHAPLAALNGDESGDLERAARQLFGL